MQEVCSPRQIVFLIMWCIGLINSSFLFLLSPLSWKRNPFSTKADASTDTVFLVSGDGESFQVSLKVAKKSGLVKTMIAGQQHGDKPQIIPLLNVDGKTLALIIELLNNNHKKGAITDLGEVKCLSSSSSSPLILLKHSNHRKISMINKYPHFSRLTKRLWEPWLMLPTTWIWSFSVAGFVPQSQAGSRGIHSLFPLPWVEKKTGLLFV